MKTLFLALVLVVASGCDAQSLSGLDLSDQVTEAEAKVSSPYQGTWVGQIPAGELTLALTVTGDPPYPQISGTSELNELVGTATGFESLQLGLAFVDVRIGSYRDRFELKAGDDGESVQVTYWVDAQPHTTTFIRRY